MQKNILQIIWVSLLLGFVSFVYYLALLIPFLPFTVTPVLGAVFAIYSYKWIMSMAVAEAPFTNKKQLAFSYIVFAAGVAIITNKCYYSPMQYGCWDAWTIWNNHAKFLMQPGYYQYLSRNDRYCVHPDYPLFIPAIIAFCWRLSGIVSQLVPLMLSFFFTLGIPVVLYFSLYRKNVYVAAVVFLLLAVNDFYLDRAMSEYGDLPLAFMLMCAIICIEHAAGQKKMVLVCGALLGCCMWIKNEGIMLSFFFALFNAGRLLKDGKWKYFAAGIALPLLTLLLFKAAVPATDLFGRQSANTHHQLTEWPRYETIWNAMAYQLNHNFTEIKFGIIMYTIFCVATRVWPNRNIIMLFCCLGGYFMVYVMTPNELEWHLSTSIDRVLMQLSPSFTYLLAMKFAQSRISIRD